MSEEPVQGGEPAVESGTTGAFYESLSEDLRIEPTMQRFKTADDLAKSYLDLRKSLGDDRVAMPKEGDAEGFDNLYEKLGMPKDGKYGIEKAQLPDGMGEQNLEAFEAKAREMRLTAEQAKGLYDWYTGTAVEAYKSEGQRFEDEMAAGEKDLRSEWGLKYEENLQKSNQAFVDLFGDQADIIKEKMGNNTAFIKGMAKAAEMVSEDGVGKFSNNNFTKTPAEARMELDTILSDSTHAYWGNKDKNGNDIPRSVHKAAVEQVESLELMIAKGK
jgi:hypothetical protein